MSHVAKAAKSAKAAKAPKSSAGTGKKRVTARRHARKKTAPPKAKPAAKKHPDTRGKAHGHRRHETIGSHHAKHHEKKHHEKKHHEHHVTDKAHHHVKPREARKHEHHTRYGAHHKAAAAARGAVKPAHSAKAAHLPHNGTAHHEQYK